MPEESVPFFSLIVCTVGRTAELTRWLDSVALQGTTDWEIILVDLSGLPAVEQLALDFGRRRPLRRIAMPVCAVSAARNAGLREARGRYCAFPDDDCVYPAGLLARVRDVLRGAGDGVALAVTDRAGRGSAGGFMSRANWLKIGRGNIWRCVNSSGLFVRRDRVGAIGGFDELLGVGAASGFHSAEENDLVLRLIGTGGILYYTALLCVHHPRPAWYGDCDRAYRYGRGCGYVLAKHSFSGWTVARLVGCKLLRLVTEPGAWRFHAAMARGRWSGFWLGRRDSHRE